MTETACIPDYETYDYTREWVNKQVEDLSEKRILSSWIKPAEACLELGGGYGRITGFLEQYFSRMAMVDFSKANIGRASLRLRRTDIARADIHNIPFKDGAFDYIFMIRVVHHLKDPLTVLREIRRVAKDGATVVISAPNPGFGKHRRLKSNTLVAVSDYGHRIYLAPLKYYFTEHLKEDARRGTGMFENFIGIKFRQFKFLHLVDVATSPFWYLKPNVFMKYTVYK